MADALGWIGVPIVPTFSGVGKKLSEELVKPTRKAGKAASDELNKSTKDVVQNLDKQVAASSGKLKKYEQDYSDAMSKRESQQHKVNAAIEEQSAAEEKFQDALKKGKSGATEKAKLERATAKVTDETLKLEKAHREVDSAQEKVDKQTKDLTDTTDKQRKAQEKLSKELKDSETPLGRLKQGFNDLRGEMAKTAKEAESIDIGGALKKGIAGGAAAAGGFLLSGMGGTLDAELQSLRVYGDTAGREMMASLGNSVAESGAVPLGEAVEIAGQITGQFNNIGMDGEKIAEEFGSEMATIGKTWNIESEQMVLAASSVMANGMTENMEEVLDLQATYFSGHTEAVVDEMLEASKEYSGAYQSLGLDYQDMLATLDVGGELGPMGVDKVGDMFNELSRVMKEDITPDMEATFETLGVNLDDIQAKMADGMGAEAVQDLITKISEIEDPAERAAASTALFGTPYEVLAADGTLDKLNESLGDQAQLARDSAGAAGELSDAYGDTLSGRIQRIKNAVMGVAEDGFMWLYDVIETHVAPVLSDLWEFFETQLLPIFERLREWAVENRDILMTLAAVIGGAAAAWGVWVGAIKTWQTVMKIAQGVQMAFNAVMAANPIMLIVIAIAALTAGLVYFFTQTETGQEIWATFTEALGVAWDWLVEKFTEGWNWLNEKVFQPLMTIWQEHIWPTLQTVFGLVIDYWTFLYNTFLSVWGWLRDNVFNPLASFVTETLWPALQTAFQWIGNAWQGLSDGLSAVWAWIKENVFQAFMNKIAEVKDWFSARIEDVKNIWQGLSDRLSAVWSWINDNVFQKFRDAIAAVKDWFSARIEDMKNIWQGLSDRLSAIWNWINDNVFQVFRNAIAAVKDWFSNRIDDIKNIWQGMADKLGSVWNWIDENVFDALGRGIDRVKGWFDKGVEGIRKAWDMLKEAAAKPVRFVINRVWNDGLRKGWNAIADFLPGLDTVEPISLGFASGGVLPGYTPGRDVHEFMSPTAGRLLLSGGEAIMRPEWVRAVGGEAAVHDMNRRAKRGNLMPIEKHSDNHAAFAEGGVFMPTQAFAGGGVIDAMMNIVREKYPMLTMTSGYRPGDSGYHGSGLATDWSNGSGNTPAQLALAHDIADTYPGSAQLIYDSPGWDRNIYEGSPAGAMDAGVYMTAQAGRHDHHVHWAMTTPPTMSFGGGVFEGGSNGGGGGGVWSWVAGKARDAWDGATGWIKDEIDSTFNAKDSRFNAIPGSAFQSLSDTAWSHITGLVGKLGGGGGNHDWSPGAGAEQWRDMVIDAFKNQGEDPRPDLVDALVRQIDTESNGDPNIAQQIVDVNGTGPSAGLGLYQFIPSTFAAYRDPSLPDDRTDPWAANNAAVRYFRDRHGWNTGPGGVGRGHGWKDGGIFDPRLTSIFDTGGVLRDGEAAVNLSGADEIVINDDQLQALNKLANNVGALVNHLVKTGDFNAFAEAMSDEFRPYIEKVQDTLTKMADPRSEEGITTRQITRRVLGLGINIPGGEIIGGLLDAEVELMNSRARHVGHLDDVAEAQAKYDEALAAHQELLGTSPEGITESDQKKLDDAQQAVDDAQDAEERAKAEQELAKIREELEKSSLESAENWAAGIEKANTDVMAAGENLAKAREAQVQDLDHIIVLSQENVEGLIPEARKLADQLLSMGAPANLVSQGLNAIVGSLMGISGVVGPAGISLGMAFDLLKVAMSLFDLIRRVISEFIGKIRDARMAARTTLADFMGALYDMAEKTAEYQHLAATRTQELNRLNNDIRVSSFELAKEVRDGFRAIGQAERNMFKERAKLDEMFENSYIAQQLRARGLLEDISSALTFRFDKANRETLKMTDEMWAQYWRYEASRAQVEKTKLQSELNLLQAQFALEDARMTSLRWQEDVNRQLARSAEMLARANGVDLEGAALGTMFADTLVDLAELQREWDENWFKRMFNADYRAGMTAEMNYLKGELAEIASVAGMDLNSGDIDALLKKMSTAAFWDLDPMAVLRGASPEIAEALRAADSYDRWQPYYDAQDQQEERDREVEDLQNLLDRFEATFGLEERIAGYDSIAEAFDRLADSYGEDLTAAERESLREEFRREMEWASQNSSARPPLDDDYADVRRQAPSTVQVVVEGGKLYSEDDVIDIVNGALEASGLDTKAEKVTASQVAASRRTVKA